MVDDSKATDVILGLYGALRKLRDFDGDLKTEGGLKPEVALKKEIELFLSNSFTYIDPGKGKNLLGGTRNKDDWIKNMIEVYNGPIDLSQYEIKAAAQIPGTTTFFIYVNQTFKVKATGKQWSGEVINKIDVDIYNKCVLRIQSFYDTYSVYEAFT